jgi:serine/threonine-protein kinase HipA
LATLGLEAQALFDGQTDHVLAALIAAGSSGGARPKAQIYFSADKPQHCRTIAQPNDEAWLVKFTSSHLPLGHEEGLCEAVYLNMAEKAELQPVQWQLLDVPAQSGAHYWLAVKRFDWVNADNSAGRYHMLSASGLLDADFRSMVCKSPAAGQLQFKRAIFNLFACNQDDHSKNWAFLQDDKGSWQPSPCYDLTFSPHPFSEHATAYAGFGKNPSLKAIQQLANHAGFKNWQQAQQTIEQIVDALSTFKNTAATLNIKKDTIRVIEKQLDQVWQHNKHLLSPAHNPIKKS